MVTNLPVPSRGDVWYAELDKLRPVVVMHRDFAGRHLRAVLAAPLTTIIRDIPTEVRLGVEHGLDRECVASMDNLTLVDRRRLQTRISRLDDRTMADMCKALSVAVACPLG